MNLKHRLPLYSTIEHLKLDDTTLKEIQKVTLELEHEFVSVIEANKKLCGFNHELTQSVYDNFFQISLTKSKFNDNNISVEECEISGKHLDGITKLAGVRNKKLLSVESGNPLNENEYGDPTEYYERYHNLFNAVLSKFKGRPTRVRLVKLNAGTSIAPHIDYDPSYAVRIIIPIITHPEAVNVFWKKNRVETVHFEPGKAYFLNTGFKHAVINFSKEARYTFMISVDGIQDIEHILLNSLS